MSAAVRDAPELRDIDMDQRPGMVVLVTPDRLTGDPVDRRESADATTHQDRVNGRRGQAELAGDLDRAETAAPPDLHDLLDDLRRRLRRHRARTARAIGHPGRAFGSKPG